MAAVLIAEDEAVLADLIARQLEKAGFSAAIARDGLACLRQAQADPPDLLILDWMLPVYSGPEICRLLRQNSKTRGIRILFLSARSETEDRIAGLESGGDDYLPKPFAMNELLARAKALLRRREETGRRIQAGAFLADKDKRCIYHQGKRLDLSHTGYSLLVHMMVHPGRVYSRGQLLDAIWGEDKDVNERTVDANISRLRRALRFAGARGVIRTARSGGYSLEPE